MSSKGAKTLIGVLLAAISGAAVGLFVLIGLIFFVPTGASNTNIENFANRSADDPPANKPAEANVSSPTPTEVESTPEEAIESPSPTPKTTFTPITLPTPAPKPTKTPVSNPQNPGGGKTPKTPSKPSPKKPIPTPSVHT